MVAPSPEKCLFEENYTSIESPLFFEFAFEATPVSFKPQPILSAPSINSNYKKILNNSLRLLLGLLITAFVVKSGILNNSLFSEKSDNRTALASFSSWSANLPLDNNLATVTPTRGKTKISSVGQKAFFLPSENKNPFSATFMAIGKSAETEISNIPEVKKIPQKNTTNINTYPNKISESVSKNRPVMFNKKHAITSVAFHAMSAQSAMDRKGMFIKFGAKWCLPCKMMESNVFPDFEIKRLLAENYHTLEIDVDNIDGINLRQFYQVEKLPSFIILDHQQKVVGRHEGSKRIEELRSILGAVNP